MNKYSKPRWTKNLILILALSASSVAYASQDVAAEKKHNEKWWEDEKLFTNYFDVEKAIEDCETTVRELNTLSETMDRMGDNTSGEIQKWFTYVLDDANECATNLTKRTGKKYKLTKDWFGSDYTLKKP